MSTNRDTHIAHQYIVCPSFIYNNQGTYNIGLFSLPKLRQVELLKW